MLFSVVVPTCDRPEKLLALLQSFAPGAQHGFPNHDGSEYEVIVADDGRDDRLRLAVLARYPWARYVRGPRKGPGPNRNAGEAIARGRWVVFLDDDCLVSADYLSALRACIDTTGAVVIEGWIVCPDKTGWPWRSETENEPGGVFYTGNLALDRGVFHALGRFDPHLGRVEDTHLGHAILESGVRTAFCRGAVARHPSDAMSLRRYVARVLSVRWLLLWRLKTGPPPLLDVGWLTSARAVVECWVLLVLRKGWHTARDAYRAGQWPPLPRVCDAVLSLAYLPVLFPYMVVWDRRFRRLLRTEQRGAPVPPDR